LVIIKDKVEEAQFSTLIEKVEDHFN
jgi:hypothetical protein